VTQLNSVQPSQSCFCLWRHDLQTESTGSLRSLIGDSRSRCERVDNSTSSWVELCRYKRTFTHRHFSDHVRTQYVHLYHQHLYTLIAFLPVTLASEDDADDDDNYSDEKCTDDQHGHQQSA